MALPIDSVLGAILGKNGPKKKVNPNDPYAGNPDLEALGAPSNTATEAPSGVNMGGGYASAVRMARGDMTALGQNPATEAPSGVNTGGGYASAVRMAIGDMTALGQNPATEAPSGVNMGGGYASAVADVFRRTTGTLANNASDPAANEDTNVNLRKGLGLDTILSDRKKQRDAAKKPATTGAKIPGLLGA